MKGKNLCYVYFFHRSKLYFQLIFIWYTKQTYTFKVCYSEQKASQGHM